MLPNPYEAELEVQDRVARVRHGVAGERSFAYQPTERRSWRWHTFQRLARPKSPWWLPAAFALGMLVGIALGGG